MNKFVATVIIAGLISGSAFAVTNVVNSANVVGYNQITIPSNQFVLVALDFNNASNTINDLFGTLPAGSSVYSWNTGSQSYVIASKSSRAGWGVSATNRIQIGTGVFVVLPANTQTNLYFSGDVPTAGTTSIYQVNGYALIAYPYPVDMLFTNTALAKNAAVGDQLSIWSNGWTTYSKSARAGWGTASNVILRVGQAFFYKSVTNSAVNEVKPYILN